MKTVTINGVEFTEKETQKTNTDNLDYVIIRGDRSGVFAGFLKDESGKEVILIEARRLWYWDGAASISQIAEEGVSKPENCKFPVAVSKIKIKDVIEILYATDAAYKSISGVPVWEK